MSASTDAAPDIYDRAPIPTDGRECKMWHENDAGEMEQCGNPAAYVFVYQQSSVPDHDSRGNCLACADCVPEVTDL